MERLSDGFHALKPFEPSDGILYLTSMLDERIQVYCDGSVTNVVMTDAFTTEIGDEYVGRAMVIIPTLDFGLIAQTREGMVAKSGAPASNEAEVFAVRTALKVCERLNLVDYVIYSDCDSAVKMLENSRVEWRRRSEVYQPNAFFDRMRERCNYLHHTRTTVTKRASANAEQIETFELLQSPYREFKLSKSTLWASVEQGTQRFKKTLNERHEPIGHFPNGFTIHHDGVPQKEGGEGVVWDCRSTDGKRHGWSGAGLQPKLCNHLRTFFSETKAGFLPQDFTLTTKGIGEATKCGWIARAEDLQERPPAPLRPPHPEGNSKERRKRARIEKRNKEAETAAESGDKQPATDAKDSTHSFT